MSADKFDEEILNVDTITGNDHYGTLNTGRIIKADGIMATESKFDWLLSGHCAETTDQQVSCFQILL